MRTIPDSLRIGVLRGGAPGGYDVSLQNGYQVLKHLSELKPIDIFVSKDGKWHMHGVEKSPERILKNVDVVWNTLHNVFPENNKTREMLHSVPHTGGDKLSSFVALNKLVGKERAISLGIKTPVFVVVRENDPVYEKAKEIFNSFPNPLLVKPITGGSYLESYIVKSFKDLIFALENILTKYSGALVEEYISGREVSCVVTDDFRGQDVYAFPPREFSDKTILDREETRLIEDIAKRIHNELALSHYSHSDFIVSPRRGVYFLEVNTTPDIRKDSLLIKSIQSVGVSEKEFLHHIISLALNKR